MTLIGSGRPQFIINSFRDWASNGAPKLALTPTEIQMKVIAK